MTFALDTNALIHALKGLGKVGRRMEQVHPSDLAVPAIVAYEIEVGTLRSGNPGRRHRELSRLLSVFAVLPFDGPSAERAARLRFDLEKRGEAIGPMDTLIAGTVLAHGATLITHNTIEFSRIPGLMIEDWY
ncbi:MAG: type II toxin-antitoxin system VapC family toxin [Bryobacterales bacterium]|nr:type II toxin-antitoxin system VapC family toxin [Bryobacterales bacterium]